MQESDFERICKNLTERLRMKKNIDEEQVHVFFDGVTDILAVGERKKNPEYQGLSDYINKIWNYGDFEKVTRTQAFLFGSIWAGVKMIEQKRNKVDNKRKLTELVSFYSDKNWFLKAIHEHPGIRHKELAKAGGMSASQLSQFVSKASKEALISYHRFGREKYYFLMEKGETVYREISRKEHVRWSNTFTKASRIGFWNFQHQELSHISEIDWSTEGIRNQEGIGNSNYVIVESNINDQISVAKSVPWKVINEEAHSIYAE